MTWLLIWVLTTADGGIVTDKALFASERGCVEAAETVSRWETGPRSYGPRHAFAGCFLQGEE